MKKLTIFTAPKPFVDPHIILIQRNAITSWLQMSDEVEILLMGGETGIAPAASELGVTYFEGVERNDQGTPLISSLFENANRLCQADLLMFSNTDMIFFPETLDMVLDLRKREKEFVLLGQRHDLDVNTAIDFSERWPASLKALVHSKAHPHTLGGSDYFIFPKGLFRHLPDFAIGRAGWDNWMIYHAISQGWLTLDATPSLMAVHQNHPYSHLAGGQSHQRHPETLKNLELAGGMRTMYSLLDLKFQLVDGQVKAIPWSLPRMLVRLERLLQPDERAGHGLRWRLLRWVRRLRRTMLEMKNNGKGD